MSALARWFKQRGLAVGGYDRVKTELTMNLEKEGISVHYEDNPDAVTSNFKEQTSVLVIYTPAVPATHKELSFFRDHQFLLKKRSEVLGMISKDHFTVAVGGTHGKTTTSSMIAHLLHGSAQGCSAFIGGIMTNYNSNLLIGDADAPVVAEADEFDRSFLRLFPDYTILTSLDPDHLDIYGDESEMHKTYVEFLELSEAPSKLLLHEDTIGKLEDLLLGRKFETFGLAGKDVCCENLQVADGFNTFDYVGREKIEGLKLQLPGYHNVSNALAAITVALDLGVTKDQIKAQMGSYLGVKRRFEYQIKTKNCVYIDDYAHHPSEIEALISSVRLLYPGKKITLVFQPHLFSRTRDFREGFIESLSLADEVIMLPIYPARELPIEGITSEIIRSELTVENRLLEKSDFPDCLNKIQTDVLLTVGAGDIDQLVPQIKSFLERKEGVSL